MFESRTITSWVLPAAFVLFARAALAVEVALHVPGVPADVADYLRGASLTAQIAAEDDATAQDVLAAARADYARLVGALYDVGHYGAVISIRIDGREAAGISPIAGPAQIRRVVIRVDPGPVFTFSNARVAPLAPGTRLPAGFATGRRAFAGLIGDAARAGIDRWRDIGHAKAALAGQVIIADHRTTRLGADIRLSPGPRLTFGNLIVPQTGAVRPERVRDIAGLPTGQVFSPDELDAAANRLRRTQAFRSVILEEADTPGPGATLDIHATLVDAKPRRIGFGAEIASLEGLTVSGFWLHRNLLGGAERLRVEGEVSGIGGDSGGIDYRLSARFDRPATFTPDTGLFVTAAAEELDDPDYRERSARIGAGLTHIFSDTLTGEIGAAFQVSRIKDDLGSRDTQLFLLPARLTFDNRDDPLDAHTGKYFDLEVTPFAGIDGGDAGLRLYADARTYLSFGAGDRITLAFRSQLGSVAGAGLAEVPPDMLFFSGGAGTVRGQPYQSLAVNLGGGKRIGGRSFWAVSSELRADVSGKWSLAAFADSGFVGQDGFGAQNGDWHSGAGVGLRYDTGIGPVRVDIATPLDDGAGESFELYVGIGQAF